MPRVLDAQHVLSVDVWPLGSVMTRKAAGERWTDVLVQLIEPIRLGGRHNTRRVRYDGRFYIMHNGRRVYLVGALAWQVYEACGHVYGLDAESDVLHNKTLKGY